MSRPTVRPVHANSGSADARQPLNLLGFDAKALTEQVGQWGNKPFRARQLLRWMHQHHVDQFADMTDLARTFREQLARDCVIAVPPVSSEQVSSDCTRKWLFAVYRRYAIVTALIP